MRQQCSDVMKTGIHSAYNANHGAQVAYEGGQSKPSTSAGSESSSELLHSAKPFLSLI